VNEPNITYPCATIFVTIHRRVFTNQWSMDCCWSETLITVMLYYTTAKKKGLFCN